jgi:hypothetical protein
LQEVHELGIPYPLFSDSGSGIQTGQEGAGALDLNAVGEDADLNIPWDAVISVEDGILNELAECFYRILCGTETEGIDNLAL